MSKEHHYHTTVTWTGNKGTGTSGYTEYNREHTIAIDGKPDILGSSDPSFRGNRNRHNPEDNFVASISACHMLWYLHLCAVNGVVVEQYKDKAEGIMAENSDGSGQFSAVTLHPEVFVRSGDMADKARALHEDAHNKCFVSRSINFPVHIDPIIRIL